MLGGGDGQEKILLSEEGGHYMKNKNIGRGVLSTQPDQRKRPQCKMRKNAKHYQILKIFPRSFHSLGILQNSYFWSS